MKNSDTLGKIRLLKLWEILQRDTDEDHPIGTEALRAKLLAEGIDCHRSTLYDDIALLNENGYEVLCRRGRSNQYYVVDRTFSTPEIHILLDAVQAANFITEKKTVELVDKLANLAGSQKADVFKHNIVQFNNTKNTNESIYYSVNEIVTAITERKKIIFLYFDYDVNHERVYRRDGHHYVVSPYATVFADGHYYLIVYDNRYKKMTHYRIDRMDKVEIIDDDAVMPPEDMKFDIAAYKKQLFGMFSGETTNVTIEADKSLIDAVFDLFGEQVQMEDCGDKIRFSADVQTSDLFFGWCSSFGNKVRILEPLNVVQKLRAYITKLDLGEM